MHSKPAGTLRSSVLCCMTSIELHGPGLPPAGLVFTFSLRALQTCRLRALKSGRPPLWTLSNLITGRAAALLKAPARLAGVGRGCRARAAPSAQCGHCTRRRSQPAGAPVPLGCTCDFKGAPGVSRCTCGIQTGVSLAAEVCALVQIMRLPGAPGISRCT
jgi:hypothetical protein